MNAHTLQIILILLTVSVITVTLFRRMHLPPILGYLIVGILVGPFGMGLIDTSQDTRFLAEFGVVFLMFTIGLEFSLAQMIAMKKNVFMLGGGQVLLTTLIAAPLAWLTGLSPVASLVCGAIISLSSTAIVIKQLADQVELNAPHGHLSVSVLLFQDMAVIPMLVIIPVLAADTGGMALPLFLVTVKAILVFGLIMAIGHWLLRPLFHIIASTRSPELFTLAVLLVTLSAAWFTHEVGLSLTLGAFLAGMMLGETEFRHQIEADIRPFQDVLLGLFFITVGMGVNLMPLLDNIHWIMLLALGLMLVKFILIVALTRLSGHSKSDAFRTGLVLAQGGEFGFVLLDLSLDSSLLPDPVGQLLFASIIISMLISPFIIRHNKRMTQQYCSLQADHDEGAGIDALPAAVACMDQHVLICGYGRIGQNLARLLEHEGFSYIALELDPRIVREAHEAGEPVHYGDASRMDNLTAAGLNKAGIVVISFEDTHVTLGLLKQIKSVRPELPVLVRTRDDAHLDELEQAGATMVMPEAVEASLMIGGQLLLLLKVPGSRIMKLMREIRTDHYKLMRDFFHGEDASSVDREEAFQERLHTITLPERSYAVGHTIADLHLWDWDVSVTAVRRGGIRGESPMPETELRSGDVLVLAGTPQHLEHAESMLLFGH